MSLLNHEGTKTRSKYKPYPEYKDSKVKNLSIPEDWDIMKLKYLSQIFNGNSLNDKQKEQYSDTEAEGFVYVSSKDIAQETSLINLDTGLLIPKCQKGFKTAPQSTTLLCIEGGSAGKKIAFTQVQVCFVNKLACFKPRERISGKYIFYSLRSREFKTQFDNAMSGLIGGVSISSLNNLFIAVPAFNHQEEIVDFLDQETSKMDLLIEKQQKLITLLKEKRQAVISHAVTKGLNPNAPLKNSGIEWLGQIPEHWVPPKLIHLTKRIGDGLHSTPKYEDSTGYYFINGNNLIDGSIHISKSTKEVPEVEYLKHFISLDESTVFLSINGTIGNTALYSGESVILGKSAAYINCGNKLLPSFLRFYLNSSVVKNYFDLEVTGTTIYNLSLNSIRKLTVCLPPIQEQQEIANYCVNQREKYDTLIEKSQQAIELLKERKTALISAAVTGKIDVRDSQA